MYQLRGKGACLEAFLLTFLLGLELGTFAKHNQNCLTDYMRHLVRRINRNS